MMAFKDEVSEWMSKRAPKLGVVLPIQNSQTIQCAVCDGTGKLLDDPCPLCNGECENKLSVEVRAVSGEVLHVDLARHEEWNARVVKQRVSHDLGIPMSCMELVHGDHLLEDTDSLLTTSEHEQHADVLLHVFITMSAITSQLEMDSVSEICKALRDLERLGKRAKHVALPLISNFLEHRNSDIRALAFSAVLATHGKEGAIDLFKELSLHPDWPVRITAMKFLSHFAVCGGDAVMEIAMQNLQHQQLEVKLCAMQLLLVLTAEANNSVIVAFASTPCLRHPDWHVRKAALQTLAFLPGSSEPEMVNIVKWLADDPNSKVREVAQTYLKGVQYEGCPKKRMTLPGHRRPRNRPRDGSADVLALGSTIACMRAA